MGGGVGVEIAYNTIPVTITKTIRIIKANNWAIYNLQIK